MKLIVNIPAYNEQAVIGQTIKKIKQSFEDDFYFSQEGKKIAEKLIQVVDDGSEDKTAQVAQEAGADIVVSYKPNRRLAYSFRRAVDSALENGADFMVNIDADGQFNPFDIPQLLEPVLKGKADMTIANRFGQIKAQDIPWIKSFLNRLAAGMIGFFLNTKIEDLTCGFRALNSEAMLRLNLTNLHFTYTQETIIDAIGKNLKLRWIPVKVVYFADRKSRIVSSISKFVSNSLKIILKAVRDVRPLKFFGWPGMLFLFIGLIGFAIFGFNYFQEFKIRPFLNIIVFASLALLMGIQLMIFAFIADMIKSNRQLTEDSIYRRRKDLYEKSKQPIKNAN